MRAALLFFLWWLGGFVAGAGPLVTFSALEESDGPFTSGLVRLDERRVAAIAVVGADPARAQLVTGEGAVALSLVVHDTSSRLTILQLPEGSDVGEVAPRGKAFGLAAGAPIQSTPQKGASPSRVVKWQNTYGEKVLPLALLLVHHPGAKPPLPGTGLYNDAGELVAINHQPSTAFGNGSFALPVEVVSRIERDFKARKTIARCWIGITMEATNAVPIVEAVRPDSPVEKAGLKKGDILLAVGEHDVETYADAVNAFYYLVSGEPVLVKVLRRTEVLTVTVVPQVHPGSGLPTGE